MMNTPVLDQGWLEFRQQLEYKQVWLGGNVLAVPTRNKPNSPITNACHYIRYTMNPPDAKVEITVHLRHIPLLADLTEAEMQQIKDQMVIQGHDKRVTLVSKGAPATHLIFLLSGQLQAIDTAENGRVVSLHNMGQGDFFGEIALINHTPYTATLVAASQVLIGLLPAAVALHLFVHAPALANRLLRHLAQQIQRDAEFRALLSIHNAPKRLFGFLLLMQQTTPDHETVVENLPAHQDIAHMINTSRETVTRALLALMQQGIIAKDAKRLIIVNPQALQKMVE